MHSQKDLTKEKANRGKHRMPELLQQNPAIQHSRASTPQLTELSRRSPPDGSLPLTRGSLSTRPKMIFK